MVAVANQDGTLKMALAHLLPLTDSEILLLPVLFTEENGDIIMASLDLDG